ncbi:hypothetical protein [Goodfellowiella coeruleoviolacea]|uniref:hypothetical protein n=1 Tax=Goodfellowiella coeruleoviolacea TaxID=334858 RepID=UPI0020A2C07B|nr:hypothetical protein [Goodfellowiella coeruleoviolacea]
MRTGAVALLAAVGLTAAATAPAAAEEYQPVETVHTERVQVGPYGMTVGFSTWPLHAMRSLDFTFTPDDGIAGKSGTLTAIGPDNPGARPQPLARHPRKRDVWGLDVRALPVEGQWTFRFTIDGPAGPGVGELTGLTVLAQPGPPMAVSWSISTLPLLGLVAFLVVAWRRVRPGRAPAAGAASG